MSLRQIRQCDFPSCGHGVVVALDDSSYADVTLRMASGYGVTTPRGWTSVKIGQRGRSSDAGITQIDVPLEREFCPRHGEMGVQTLLDDKTNLYLIVVRVPETP